MARIKAELSSGARLADYLTVGFLAMNCPLDQVRRALAANDAESKRPRGLPDESRKTRPMDEFIDTPFTTLTTLSGQGRGGPRFCIPSKRGIANG